MYYYSLEDIQSKIKKKTFKSSLLESKEKYGIEVALDQLRVSDIVINKRGSNRHRDKLKEIIEALSASLNGEEKTKLTIFLEELSLLEELLNVQSKSFSSIKKLKIYNSQTRLTDCLVMGHSFISRLTNEMSSSAEFETYVVAFSNIIRLLLFFEKEAVFTNEITPYPMIAEDMKKFMDYSALSDRLSVWVEDWKYTKTKVSKQKSKTKIRVTDELLKSNIAKHRYTTTIDAKLHRQAYEEIRINKNSEEKVYLNFEHEIEFIKQFLNVERLESVIDKKLGIDLLDLAKAFFTLKKIVYDFNQLNFGYSQVDDIVVERVLPQINYEKLYHNFMVEGIDEIKIDTLIKLLTFNSKSESIFESPLIEVKENVFTLITPVVLLTNISNSLIRIMAQQSILSDKGFEYERKFKEMVESSGFGKCISLKKNVGDATYELDGAFFNNGTLYLCELKNWGFPNNSYEYYRLMGKVYDAIDQMDRIQMYFTSEGINELYEGLSISQENVKEIKKLVIITPFLGEIISHKGINIVEGIITRNFFKQNFPQKVITVNNIIQLSTMRAFREIAEMKLTNNAFNYFIDTNPHIRENQKSFRKKFTTVPPLHLSLGYYEMFRPTIQFAKKKQKNC